MWTRVSQFIAYKIQPTSGTKWISPMIYRVLLRVQGEPKVKMKGTGYLFYFIFFYFIIYKIDKEYYEYKTTQNPRSMDLSHCSKQKSLILILEAPLLF